MYIIEHKGAAALVLVIDEITRENNSFWGIARVKRHHLRPITEEAFLLGIRSSLQETTLAHVVFVDAKRIFIVWSSPKKSVYRQLRSFVGTAFAQPGSSVKPSVIVAYIDPMTKSEALKNALKAPSELADRLFDEAENEPIPEDIENGEDMPSDTKETKAVLTATSTQVEHYQQMNNEKPYRKKLQMLVAEDQLFSQKLLCDVLRSARARNNNETPQVDAVEGIQEAWKIFLKKAPDLTFVDLGLVDGSGHTLARAMKELDPFACVIIVTANNYEEEQSVARQNNVDGFIGKPYNKKQIFDYIDRYVSGFKQNTKGVSRGASN